ncbi:hypothetical protein DL764_008290 [Monosporascus ibericus]|uniref:Kinetochore protein mis13 n=1 Tax=Monosporascus ibericus TaxID=155417 RepID=A0A4Q4T0W9_9PEZI|nr:hypothetical protein DL764_008290 [Monosporascus ibericus]
MSNNQPKRRRSERLAAYEDNDGDFHFTRGSKRIKTAQPEPIPEDEPAPPRAPAPASRKTRSKLNKDREAPQPQPVPTRRTSKRRSSQLAVQDEPAPPPPPPPQRTTRRKARASPEKVEKAATAVKKQSRVTNGESTRNHVDEAPVEAEAETEAAQSTPMDVDKVRGPDNASNSKKIALPFSDTPIINRNKEMRRKTGGRRSSLGMRGRRASSLIDNGHSAIPHREVDPAEFYKHIEADGPSEPRRMKQLLTWCGERALAQKPRLGSLNSNAVLGARAIQDQLLKDFSSKSEFSDWFAREDVPRPPAIVKPNPRNVEHDEKILQLEERIKRLKEERKKWQSLKKQLPPELPPLFPSPPPASSATSETSSSTQQQRLPIPDASLLDPDEAEMLSSLTESTGALSLLERRTRDRVRALRAQLEFRVDRLADGVHKTERRVAAAGRQADQVLALSAARLRTREQKEKEAAGTAHMPVMEVLRSLGRILPEGGG